MGGKVSAIITSYNRPKMVVEAIESVLRQTYEKRELILCDDGSNEETRKAFEPYLSRPDVKYYQSDVTEEERARTKWARFAKQINQGFNLSTGDYITYLCDDDLFLPRRFEVMAGYLDAHPDVHVVYAHQLMVVVRDGRTYKIGVRPSGNPILDDPFCVIDHSSVMHRRECFEAVGGWPEDTPPGIGADGYFWRKLTGAGWKFYPVGQVLDIHRFHEGAHYSTPPSRW